jgi:hypothetical protein
MGSNMQDIQYEQEMELSRLPIEYTINMALENNDVIKYGVVPYNAKRLELFILNYLNKMPDKVRIIDYGIDSGYNPAIGILQYNGEYIVYTQRYYRFPEDTQANYQTYYGGRMRERYRRNDSKLLRDYLLVTFNNIEITVFSELL